MEVLHRIDVPDWEGPFAADARAAACEALESGKVLYLPHLAFALEAGEHVLLTPEVSNGKSKNVSLKPSGEIGGTCSTGDTAQLLKTMMARFADTASRFVESLVPAYAHHLERGFTSYRPVEIAGRPASEVHDDTRLHVDAFPSRPTRGRRILRLFSNIHPAGSPRVWRVGEPFEQMARRFLPGAREGSRARAWMLSRLGITNGMRSAYDGLMLGLHDGAKRDEPYQRQAPQTEIPFPAGSTWMCYTDQVMHAATAGQFVLEQTFHPDVTAMVMPERCPLRILERLRGRALV
ncbi:MAG TPA: Kdo hydroxylase family protein [Rhizomicrobium sp.]|jgi:hypothetical protein|nr:Kdo hydroxylase family protein [Rhizomicrobium sp.]